MLYLGNNEWVISVVSPTLAAIGLLQTDHSRNYFYFTLQTKIYFFLKTVFSSGE